MSGEGERPGEGEVLRGGGGDVMRGRGVARERSGEGKV